MQAIVALEQTLNKKNGGKESACQFYLHHVTWLPKKFFFNEVALISRSNMVGWPI